MTRKRSDRPPSSRFEHRRAAATEPPDSRQKSADQTSAATVVSQHSPAYLKYILLMAFLLNVNNVTDRLVVGVLIEPLRLEFGLSDLQLGLLSGLAFTLVYSTLGIPFGRLADKVNRRNLVVICVAFWSSMTVLTGAARGYVELIMIRAGVALGEAGFTPAMHSLLSDFFPPHRRASALSIYGIGSPLGTMLAFVVGGFVAEHFGWRLAFVVIGLPGILLAIVMLMTMREPQRGATELQPEQGPAPPLRQALLFPWRTRSIRYLMLGAGAHLTVFYGLSTWLAPFFLRVHDLSLSQAGLAIGIITAVFGTLGTLLGGFASDRLGAHRSGWYAWVTAVALMLVLPFGVGMYIAGSAAASLMFACGVALFGAVWLGPTFAIVQMVAPLRMRGLTAGVLIFTQNMIGLGCGPVLVGALSDSLAPGFGDESLRWALLAVLSLELLAIGLYYQSGRWMARDLAKVERR